ncbi:MAG: hypothetical protein WAX66_04320 [Patescibacteria group bacterium]
MIKLTPNSSSESSKLFGFKELFKIVINAVVIVIIISTGGVLFIAGHVIPGILFCLLSLVVLVPQKYLKVTNSIKLIIICIIYAILATMFGNKMPKTEVKYENYDLRQEFNLNLPTSIFIMSVQKVSTSEKVNIDSKEVTTTGNFIEVRGIVKNSGSSPAVFKLTKPMELKDSQNRIFTLKASSISSEAMQPSVGNEFLFIFETPKDATGLILVVYDKTDTAKAINLKK